MTHVVPQHLPRDAAGESIEVRVFAPRYVLPGGGPSITQLGTVTFGTWQASIIAPVYLGTGTPDTTKFLRGDGAWKNILTASLGLCPDGTSLTGYGLRNSLDITGTVTAFAQRNDGMVAADVTTGASYYSTSAETEASAFTLTALRHFIAQQGTIGAGSTVTNQYGFFADSTLTGATNNYGFYGNIAAGTNRWNVYAPGTAFNHMAGALGLGNGVTTLTGYVLRVGGDMTGATTTRGIASLGNVKSDVTSSARYFQTTASTQASAFTVSDIYHFVAEQGTFGAGSAVTRQAGYFVASSLTGATTNYGFRGQLAASASARWNTFMDGTAPNHWAGQGVFGGTTLDTTALLNLISTTQGFLPPRMTTTQRDAISSPTDGLLLYNSTTAKHEGRQNGAWATLGSHNALTVNTTTVGNVGTGEDDLMTYSVPAATLAVNGQRITFRASGSIANTVDAKRLRVKFGATTILDTGAAGIPVSAAIDWVLTGEVIRTGAATQKCNVLLNTNNATFAAFSDYATAAETLSGAVTLKLTGEATSNNDVVQETLTVDLIR